jgi:hypothetical protein
MSAPLWPSRVAFRGQMPMSSAFRSADGAGE